MQIDGLVLFQSFTDQAITSLYFLGILISFSSFSYVKSAAMITDCALSTPKKAYFRCLGNSFRINHSNFFFLSLVPSLHCCLNFLHSLHSNLKLCLLIQHKH